jgi:hypothetical protein
MHPAGGVMRASIIAAAALLLPLPAAAQDCREQVDALAGKLGFSTDLPQGAGSTAGAPQQPPAGDLASSGGVIQPPETGDMPTIEPPAGENSKMPTAPRVQPQAPGGADHGSQPAKDAQIQSLLTAARQAADAGDHQACLDRLQEASALAAGDGA